MSGLISLFFFFFFFLLRDNGNKTFQEKTAKSFADLSDGNFQGKKNITIKNMFLVFFIRSWWWWSTKVFKSSGVPSSFLVAVCFIYVIWFPAHIWVSWEIQTFDAHHPGDVSCSADWVSASMTLQGYPHEIFLIQLHTASGRRGGSIWTQQINSFGTFQVKGWATLSIIDIIGPEKKEAVIHSLLFVSRRHFFELSWAFFHFLGFASHFLRA